MSKGSRINRNFAESWSGRWESNPLRNLKDEMKACGLDAPDDADALALTFARNVAPPAIRRTVAVAALPGQRFDMAVNIFRRGTRTIHGQSADLRASYTMQVIEKYGAPGGTRTPDLLVRSYKSGTDLHGGRGQTEPPCQRRWLHHGSRHRRAGETTIVRRR